MDAIPPDIAKKLLNRDFANLVKRVQAGGKINRTERAMLQSMASGAGGDGPAYVRNFVELAVALKVSRQTINGWKKFDDAPKPEANGLHDVAKWREFLRTRGLKGGEETPDIQQALKARKLLAEVEERELRLAVRRGDFVAVEQVKKEWIAQISRARALLEARLLDEMPPVLSGKDAHGIREELERFVIEFYELLHGATDAPRK
jgi:hypothetical protein